MAIAFQRVGRFKAWVKGGIVGFFRGIKNGIVRLVRGNRCSRENDIALEVTEDKELKVNIITLAFVTSSFLIFDSLMH